MPDGLHEMDGLEARIEALRAALRATGGVAVAFSGGVDSAFLAAVAREELGERALAVTALSPTYSQREQQEAARVARLIGIRHVQVESSELDIAGFAENPVNRCYHCKRELFRTVARVAAEVGIRAVADGTNADDLADHRPGLKAAREAGVLMPLLDAGLTKADIRAASRAMGLPTADKPATACLASRFPYGTRITAERLEAVDAVEECLRAHGFRQVRVRYHGSVARIEVGPDEIPRLFDARVRDEVTAAAREAGFAYAAADLLGYRTGSMNEAEAPGAPEQSEGEPT